MRRLSYSLLSLCCVLVAHGQTNDTDVKQSIDRQKAEFALRKAQMEEEMNKFRQEAHADMQNFRDSVNAEFARFLEDSWKDFELTRVEAGFAPRPRPVVYVPELDKGNEGNAANGQQPEQGTQTGQQPRQQSEQGTQPKQKPAPEQPKPTPVTEPKPAPEQPKPVYPLPSAPSMRGVFYGQAFEVAQTPLITQHLSSTNGKDVSRYWSALARLDVKGITDDLERQRASLSLDEWGVYQLANTAAPMYGQGMTENERVVAAVFLLNQLGYKAKIGCAGQYLYVLLCIKEKIWNTTFFSINGDKYYVMNPHHRSLSSISTVTVDHPLASRALSLELRSLPKVSANYATKDMHYAGNTYRIKYNKSLVDYLATYPCTEHRIYGIAPMDRVTLQSFEQELGLQLKDKTQVEALDFLLHFVQHALEYKTDDEHFGYEKWNFAEETVASDYNDCEDRAVLFAQLVRRLLGLKVVLVNYPQQHLATAVSLSDGETHTGDGFTHAGRRYIICDPTYINADCGMAMPGLTSQIEIIPL